jgi:uncharacterized protein YhaN
MRIRRLDLLRYGHFTDTDFQLPATQSDFHVVYGPNEAGKSTALSAIEDLFFGIPHNSPRNFLHDYNSMRVGALLESGAETLEVRRRKGNRDTLLDKSGTPLPAGDAALAGMLAGADKAFFTRMFCLDHERLKSGGQEILQAQDDVGQMLFSAGAGIVGLRDRRKAIDEEADTLWASRRAAHRKYYQAEDKLKAADAALREHTVTAAKWQELKTALEDANAAYSGVETAMEGQSAELRKLNRVRRVFRDVRKRAQLAADIEALGTALLLPEGAAAALDEAIKDDGTANTRIETLTEEIEKLQKESSALSYEEPILMRADDIARLHERRIQIRLGRTDLPKRRTELTIAEAHLARLASELEWDVDDSAAIMRRIPTRPKLTSARSLLNLRGELNSAVDGAKTAVAEAEDKASDLAHELAEADVTVDISTLGAAIKACREAGDISGRIAAADREAKDADAACERLLKTLRPLAETVDGLLIMTVPHKDAVQSHRDTLRDFERRKQSCDERVRSAEQELARHNKAYTRIATSEHAVQPEEFDKLREHRDLGWSIIRRKYVEPAPITDAEIHGYQHGDTLSNAYEGAIKQVDEAADRRYEKAEATARLAEITRQVAEQQELLVVLRAENDALVAEQEKHEGVWQALWNNAGLSPLSPDEMLVWIDMRIQIVQSADKGVAAGSQASAHRSEEESYKAHLSNELGILGMEMGTHASKPLRILIELAADIHKRHEKESEDRRSLEASIKKANADTERKRKSLQAAETRFSEWQEQFAAELIALALNPASAAESLVTQLNVFDDMREVAAKITELQQERIDKIERDITAYEQEVSDLVQAIAAQLSDMDPDDAVLELERRVEDATRVRQLIADKETALGAQQQKIDECHKSRVGARRIIDELQEAAAVSTVEALRIVIGRSDQMRSLRRELDAATEAIASDGDGLSVAELTDECAIANPDQLAAREETIGQELQSLRERLMEARQSEIAARHAFEAVGGDDGAARAAADRQSALAEMKEISEQYIRLRSSALLLQWAIDRYRREKQAPLLRRAGELFSILTGNSFTDLQLEFDQNDNARLAGMRHDGKSVSVTGMSTGSADQLYLALRVAAIEDYLDHAPPLPFIADDLFINFDDDRAAAGFRVLGELARKTQVLFFTHHEHLIDIANKALGAKVSAIRLPGQNFAAERNAPLAAVASG